MRKIYFTLLLKIIHLGKWRSIVESIHPLRQVLQNSYVEPRSLCKVLFIKTLKLVWIMCEDFWWWHPKWQFCGIIWPRFYIILAGTNQGNIWGNLSMSVQKNRTSQILAIAKSGTATGHYDSMSSNELYTKDCEWVIDRFVFVVRYFYANLCRYSVVSLSSVSLVLGCSLLVLTAEYQQEILKVTLPILYREERRVSIRKSFISGMMYRYLN